MLGISKNPGWRNKQYTKKTEMPAFEGLLLRQMVMTQKTQAMHVLDIKKGREEVDNRQSRQTDTEGNVARGVLTGE